MRFSILSSFGLLVCLFSSGTASAQPDIPVGQFATVTVSSAQAIQMGPYYTYQIQGQWNVVNGQATMNFIKVELVYVNANGQPNGYVITQTVSNTTYPNYSTTILNMPQNNSPFLIKMTINYTKTANMQTDSFSMLANDGAQYRLFP